jgi:DNA-binding NarL/FixJ family response regulator
MTKVQEIGIGKDEISILVVDDHQIVRDGIVVLLDREADIRICGAASNYQDCVEVLKKETPDVVVVDIFLPGPSGFEIIQYVQNNYPSVSILVLSAHDEPFYAERALRLGAKGYVSKLDSTSSVIEAIHRVMQGETYLSHQLSTLLVKKLVQCGQNSGSILDSLSTRELEVFLLIGQGLGTRKICDKLHLSPKTIETHRSHIKRKLGVDDGAQLVKLAIDWSKARESV